MTHHRIAGARGVLFDKDGTLFAAERVEGEFGWRLIAELSQGEPALARALAERAGFDRATGRYAPRSPIANGDWPALAEAWSQTLEHWRADELLDWVSREATSRARLGRPPSIADLPALLDRLRAAGLALGLATQDATAAARADLERAGVADRFAFLAGGDGPWPAKPDPALLRAFCDAVGLAAGEIVVVGDGLDDLRLGRAGGAAASIGVLSGPADADLLAAEADLLLPCVQDLPDALGV